MTNGFKNRTLPCGGAPAYDDLWNLKDMIDVILPHCIDDVEKSSILLGLVGAQVGRNPGNGSACYARCVFGRIAGMICIQKISIIRCVRGHATWYGVTA